MAVVIAAFLAWVKMRKVIHRERSSSTAHHLFTSVPLLQVVYPALDAKVKNVTLAYSVEHEDEVRTTRG